MTLKIMHCIAPRRNARMTRSLANRPTQSRIGQSSSSGRDHSHTMFQIVILQQSADSERAMSGAIRAIVQYFTGNEQGVVLGDIGAVGIDSGRCATFR